MFQGEKDFKGMQKLDILLNKFYDTVRQGRPKDRNLRWQHRESLKFYPSNACFCLAPGHQNSDEHRNHEFHKLSAGYAEFADHFRRDEHAAAFKSLQLWKNELQTFRNRASKSTDNAQS
mmetsp:Transcript_16188/g.32809  ORF Transcript_16188/g.32809 Transcript_16188/m.32809 type:complete len:119 (-) Transcript_16188:81-437(-)